MKATGSKTAEGIKELKDEEYESTCGYNQGCSLVASQFPENYQKCLGDDCDPKKAKVECKSSLPEFKWACSAHISGGGKGEFDDKEVGGDKKSVEEYARALVSAKCKDSKSEMKYCNEQASKSANEAGKKRIESAQRPGNLPRGNEMTIDQGQHCAFMISVEQMGSEQDFLAKRKSDIAKLLPDHVAKHASLDPEGLEFSALGERYGNVLSREQQIAAFKDKNPQALAGYLRGVGSNPGETVDLAPLGDTGAALSINAQHKAAADKASAAVASAPAAAAPVPAVPPSPDADRNPGLVEPSIPPYASSDADGGVDGATGGARGLSTQDGASPDDATDPSADAAGPRADRAGRPAADRAAGEDGPPAARAGADPSSPASVSASAAEKAAAKTAAATESSGNMIAMVTIGAALIGLVPLLFKKSEGGRAGGSGGATVSTDSGVSSRVEQFPNQSAVNASGSCLTLRAPTAAQIEACRGVGFQLNGGILEPIPSVNVSNQNVPSGPNLLVPTGTRGTTEQLLNVQPGGSVETTFGQAMPGASDSLTGAVTAGTLRIRDVVSEGVVVGDYRTGTIARYPSRSTADKPALLDWFTGAAIWARPAWPAYRFQGLSKANLQYQERLVDWPKPQTVNIGRIGSWIEIKPFVDDMRIDMMARQGGMASAEPAVMPGVISTIIKGSVFKGSSMASAIMNLDSSAINVYLLKAVDGGSSYIVRGPVVITSGPGSKVIQSSHGVPPSKSLSLQQCRLVYGGPCPASVIS